MFFSIQFWSEIWLLQLQIAMSLLYISHNAPYLPPKFCITFVFPFCWVLQLSQEKLKTMLMQHLGGLACENVHFSSLFTAGYVSRGGTSVTQ